MPGQVVSDREGEISNSDLVALLNRFDKGLCVVDSMGKAVLCDEAFSEMTGFTPEELVGQNFHEVCAQQRSDGAWHSAEDCPPPKQGTPDPIESEFLWGKDGRRFHVEGLTLSVGDHKSEAICVFGLRGLADPINTDQDVVPPRNARGVDHQVFYIIDPGASRFVYVGPGFEGLTGQKRQEGDSKHSLWFDLVIAEDCSRAETDYRRLLAGTAVKSEYRIQSANGSTRWVVNHAVPLLNAEGTVHAIAGLAKDATETDDTELLRRREEGRFRRLLANLPDIGWTADQDGRTVYISPSIEAVAGFSAQEIYANGRNLFRERVHPDDFPRVRRAFRALFDSRQEFDEEFRLLNKRGEWIWIHDRAVRTHEEDGILYADGVLSDITRRKNAELELQSKTALLEAQINSTIDGILVVDANGQRILQNQRFLEIFQVPVEILDNTDDRIMLNYVTCLISDPSGFLAKIAHLNRHPMETSRDEIELKDGTILDRYSSPVVASDGKYYGRIWTFRDITQRKRNEDALSQLSLAVEQSPVSVLITDPKGNISYVNRQFTECTGYTLDEVIHKNPRILNSGYSTKERYKALWSTITKGEVWRGEFRNKKKSGELYWEAATITPIVNSSGAITHFVAMKEDISERRTMEAQLRQAQKLEAIGQLAAGIAHEINTPTQFVTDNLVFLRDSWMAASQLIETYRESIQKCDEISPEVIAKLQKAEQAADLTFICSEVPRAIDQGLDGAKRVATIVRAMKEFSHPDSADKTQIDLNKAIESTITVARNEWKYVAEIVTEFDPTLPPVICYPGEVNQVILNLIVNAAHSIKEKGETKGKITICTVARGEFVEISISDTGTGIPEAIQTRIFEPFFTTKEVGKGTGQGLALAHSVIVRKHHGRIWFDTEIGRGTSFFIELPLDLSSLQEEK
ncbi:MAG TPA: PAS domain S-box protein [Terracidiphilus sp.]|nr:PAS domain S-box protein [Terracidiphilus sp.]